MLLIVEETLGKRSNRRLVAGHGQSELILRDVPQKFAMSDSGPKSGQLHWQSVHGCRNCNKRGFGKRSYCVLTA